MNKVDNIEVPHFMKILYLMQNLDSFNYRDLFVKIKMTYSHYVKILKTFEQLGWVTLERDGRQGLVTITKDGSEIVRLAGPFMEKIMPYIRADNVVINEYVF